MRDTFSRGFTAPKKHGDDSDEGIDAASQDVIGPFSLADFILKTFWPRILRRATKHPRLAKCLGIMVLAITVGSTAGSYIGDLFDKVLSTCTSRVRVFKDDSLYTALHRWLEEHAIRKTRAAKWDAQSTRRLRLTSKIPPWWPASDEGKKTLKFQESSPFYFWHKWRLFRYEFVESEDHSIDGCIRTLGFSKVPIESLLEDAWEAYVKDHASTSTDVWSHSRGGWTSLSTKRARQLSTVDLHDEAKKALIADLERYLDLVTEKVYYADRGIPYRRGYLFHGPPGTGKSSLTMAIAGHFKSEVHLLSLADPDLNDSTLASLVGMLDKPDVLLLEDVDSAGLTREVATNATAAQTSKTHHGEGSKGHRKPEPEDTKKSGITLSGLLNALDGAASPEGAIVIMTTNAPEALDPALTRPGRIDYKVAFQNADKDLARKVFKRMTDHTDKAKLEEQANTFAQRIPDGQLSPAELQGYLLAHGHNSEAALKNLESWVAKTIAEKQARSSKDTKSTNGESRQGGGFPKPAGNDNNDTTQALSPPLVEVGTKSTNPITPKPGEPLALQIANAIASTC